MPHHRSIVVSQAVAPDSRGPSLHAAFARARLAQARWAALPVAGRLAVLRRFRHLLAEHGVDLCQAVPRPAAETLTAQIIPLADHVRFLERHAGPVLRPRRLGVSERPLWLFRTDTRIEREPLGLVLVVAPSNYPVFIPGTQVVQALAAGNAVLIKPAPRGLSAASALRSLFVEAGVDPDLITVLDPAPETAAAAVRIGPDKVLFTGSSETGRSILAACAGHLTPCTLELSGSDAVFVRADADLHRVVRALEFGLTLNDGATCIAPRRVFVHRSCQLELHRRLAVALAQIPPIPLDPRQVAEVRMLHSQACQLGAVPLWPSRLDWDHPVGPIVVGSASPSMSLLQADLFAPVLAIVPVDSDAEALEAAAVSPFGLGASVFSKDETAARALAARIEAGVVTINDLILPTADPRVPFGGRRASGYGVTRGLEGLLDLTRPKVVAARRGRWLPHLDRPRPTDAALFASALRALHGATVWKRLAASLRLVRLGRQRSPLPSSLPVPPAIPTSPTVHAHESQP